MALNRERRTNAGNLMAKLLDDEEEDEFYTNTYGGFQETEEDNDYQYVVFNSSFTYFELCLECLKVFVSTIS